MIVNLGSKKSDNNENYYPQLSHVQNSLRMIIVGTPEKYLYHVEGKSDTRKVRISSLKSSSILFSCSVCAIYNRVCCAQKQFLMLKSHIPGIDL